MCVEDFVEFILHLWRLDMMIYGPFLDRLNHFELLLDVTLLLFVFGLKCVLENFVAVEHGKPFEARHKFVDDLADFVSIASATHKDFNVILAQQTLRLQVSVLDIEAALTELSLRVWTILRDGLVKEIILLKSICTTHRMLNAVLNLAKEEHCILSCVQLTRGHRMVRPSLQDFVLEVLEGVLAPFEEHR